MPKALIIKDFTFILFQKLEIFMLFIIKFELYY